MKSRQHIL